MATLSQEGFNRLKKEEGYKQKAYHLKGEKYCTCCLGHYGADVDCGRTYTDAECQAFFAKDAARFNADVNKIYDPNTMTQNQFDAMFSFAYNHGNISKTQLGKTIKANPKNYAEIQRVWESSYVGGKYAAVLKKRRSREAALYCGSSYDSNPINNSSGGGSSSGGSGGGSSSEEPAFEYEPNVYTDVSSGYSDVDYAALNQAQAFAVNQMDATYNAFNIVQDASNAVLGAKVLEISTFNHGGGAEDHNLISDDSIRPAIAQDEHSNIVKEDTDKIDDGYYKTTDDKSVPQPPGIAVSSGFAI